MSRNKPVKHSSGVGLFLTAIVMAGGTLMRKVRDSVVFLHLPFILLILLLALLPQYAKMDECNNEYWSLKEEMATELECSVDKIAFEMRGEECWVTRRAGYLSKSKRLSAEQENIVFNQFQTWELEKNYLAMHADTIEDVILNWKRAK